MVALRIRKIGKSLGITFPPDAINRFKIETGQRLYLTEGPYGTYQFTSYDPAFEKKMAKAEDIIRRYRKTLHVLAK